MNADNNLLVELHRWAWRQDENFTTEAFAHLLRHLLSEQPEAGLDLLELLIGSQGKISATEASSVSIRTQESTEKHGIPDVRITAPGVLVFIEVKVGANVDEGQLRAYMQELEQSGVAFTRLVLLTPYFPELPSELERGVRPIRWYQVGDTLEGMLDQYELSEVSCFLGSQFEQFLQERKLVAAKVRSGVSTGLRAYLERAGDDSMFSRRVQSLEALADQSELGALYDLLMLMGQVIAGHPDLPKPLFDSGQQQGGWIGYNIEQMKYFFCVYLADPEIVYLERFKGGVDAASFDSKVGRIYEAYKEPRWCNEFDLADPELEFFTGETGKARQAEILEDFLSRSLEAARKLKPFRKPQEDV